MRHVHGPVLRAAAALLSFLVASGSAMAASTEPSITSFTPTSGPPGTAVAVRGSRFSAVSAVSVGGVKATTFKVLSPAKVRATVPLDARSGKITVTTSHGSATSSASFTFEATAADGSGALTTTTASVANGSAGNTVVFTFTAAGALAGGSLRITVPSGWSKPTSRNMAGCTTASSGTVSTGGETIAVSKLTLATAGTVTITYGATSGGACAPGDGATASTTAGATTFQAQERSTPIGTLTGLASSPLITVLAANGTGTLTTPTTTVAPSSAGTTLVFTYTAGTGGIRSGTVTITVPTGWTAPVTTSSSGCTSGSAGTLVTNGQVITVSGVTLAAGAALVVTYGATSGGSCTAGDGVTTPATAGGAGFAAQEASSATGALTALANSPTISVT